MEICPECNRLVIAKSPMKRVGDLEMDVENRRVTLNGETLKFQAGEFAVLERLMSAPGFLLNKWDILETYRTGGQGTKSDINDYTPYSAARLPALIVFKLRRKIGFDRIETVFGEGYRLVAHPEKAG